MGLEYLFGFELLYLFLLFVWMQRRIVFQRDLGPSSEREAAGAGEWAVMVMMVGRRFIFTLVHQRSLYSLALEV